MMPGKRAGADRARAAIGPHWRVLPPPEGPTSATMSPFSAALTASSPAASRPAALICSPMPGSAPQK